jgi:hypothetical protein
MSPDSSDAMDWMQCCPGFQSYSRFTFIHLRQKRLALFILAISRRNTPIPVCNHSLPSLHLLRQQSSGTSMTVLSLGPHTIPSECLQGGSSHVSVVPST